MNNALARLHDTVIALLKQVCWKDVRHLNTLAWMVADLLLSSTIHLSCGYSMPMVESNWLKVWSADFGVG